MQVRVYVDTAKTRLRFDRLPKDVIARLSAEAQRLADDLLAKTQGLASGAVLQVRSGKYVSALHDRVRTKETGVYASVFSRDPRVNLFEFGGKTAPHEIATKTAGALVLQVSGGQIFRGAVHHPGGDYGREQLGAGSRGKYSVIFAAYDEMRGEIFTRLYDAADRGIEDGEK